MKYREGMSLRVGISEEQWNEGRPDLSHSPSHVHRVVTKFGIKF